MADYVWMSLEILVLYYLAAIFFAPRAVRYFFTWRREKRVAQFILFLGYGVFAFLSISSAFVIGLKSFL